MKRLDTGLVEGMNYIRNEKTGKIDWFKMVPEEYLYIKDNKKSEIESRLGKNISDIKFNELEQNDFVIKLDGIRYLLDLRGYSECRIKLDVATPEYAAATCSIIFIPNEENVEQTFSGNASAHTGSTKNFMRKYIVEAASNRALCRAVRFYLNINSVSTEELGDGKDNKEEEPSESKSQTLLKPHEMLEKLLKEKNISFNDAIKGIENSDKWKDIKDVPKSSIFAIMGKIKKESNN